MNGIKKRRFESKNIEHRNKIKNKNKEINRNKYSKSQKCLKLSPNELINNFDCTMETAEFINSLNGSDAKSTQRVWERNKNFYLNNSQISELCQEEINYNIDDTTKNNHDTTDSSKMKKEIENEYEYEISNSDINNSDIINNYNLYNNKNKSNDINYSQKQYLIEEKNKYIKELEKRIESQENMIHNLLDFKNTFNGKVTHKYNSNRIPANYFRINSFENKLNNECCKRVLKKMKKEDDIKSRTYEGKLYNKMNSDSNTINRRRISSIDKYNILYSKYLQLSNDFKYLSNNNLLNEIGQIKNKNNHLQEENIILKYHIEEKNKIIERLKNENNTIKQKYDTNCKIQYILGGDEEKEVIKSLKQQVETFKKDLVLSQAMVNSLKSEIDQLNKKNKNLQDKINLNYNSFNTNANNNNNFNDKYIFTFNDNNNTPIMSMTPQSHLSQNFIFNDLNNDNSQNLRNSLNNKNKLLSKVLAENNQLRKRLKKFDSFLPDFNYTNSEEKEENEKLKNLKKFEEKFKYFNDYIKAIKKSIEKIYEDMRIVFNKYTNKIENKILSDKFIFDLYELRKEYNNIKTIDMYNLDITDDKKCIKIYKNIMKLLSEELENVMKDKKKEILKNPNYTYETKNLNLNELNLIQNNLKNDNNNILINRDKQYNNTDLLVNENNKSLKYIPNYRQRNSTIMNQNGNYNFEYGKNFDDIKMIEGNFKSFYSSEI